MNSETCYNGLTLAHLSVMNSDKDLLLSLLMFGVDVNVKDLQGGRTPLHFAVRDKNLDIARFLLKSNACVDEHTIDNLTALHIAVANCDLDMVRLLVVEHGASVNPVRRFNGKTPLYIAVEYNYPEIADLLLTYGASVSEATLRQTTLLHLAISKGSQKLIWSILNHLTADEESIVNTQDPFYGKTPLHLAIEHEYHDVVSVLLDKGADIHAETWGRLNGLHLAVMRGDERMIDLLLRYVEPCQNNCSVSLHYAIQCKYENMMKLQQNNTAMQFDNESGFGSLYGSKSTAILDLAVRERCTWMINFMLEYGAIANLSPTNVEENMLVVKCVAQLMSQNKCKRVVDNMQNIREHKSISRFYDECVREIEMMKVTKIVGNVSFYNVLTKNVNALAAYARYDEFVATFAFTDYDRMFPIYANTLRINFVKGRVRRIIIDASLKSFGKLMGYDLPAVCTKEIMYYLPNKDLKNIISAAYDAEDENRFNSALGSFLNSYKIFVE